MQENALIVESTIMQDGRVAKIRVLYQMIVQYVISIDRRIMLFQSFDRLPDGVLDRVIGLRNRFIFILRKNDYAAFFQLWTLIIEQLQVAVRFVVLIHRNQ